MFYSLIYFTSMGFSSLFLIMKHPLAMGLMLLIQTILICLLTGSMMKTFWFSYILFLIFLGGMLVLFIYVTSLASNEMFYPSTKMFLFMMILLMGLMMSALILDKTLLMTYFMNFENSSICMMESFLNENSIMLNKLYNFPMNLITVLLMIYLFLTLIVTVKITNVFEGPLRPKN